MVVALVGPNDQIVIPSWVDLHDPHLFVPDTHSYRSPNYLTPAQLPVPRNEQTVVEHVWHKTEGHLAGDMSRLLDNKVPEYKRVSCHSYCPRDIGPGNMRWFVVVDDANEAWQCGVGNSADKLDGTFRKYIGWGNENLLTIGDELEGLPNEQFTQWQMLWCLWRQIQLSKRYPKMLPDRDHIIGHYQITRQKSDPQLFPWGGFMNALNANINQPAEQPLLVGGSKYPIVVAEFKRLFSSRPDAIQVWGLPISDAHQEVLGDGKQYMVQYFERARFELHTELDPDQVLLGLVGVEALAAKHSEGGH